jgi:anti-anti-sigma regulatory factor
MDLPQVRVRTVGDVTVAQVGGADGEPLPDGAGFGTLIDRGAKKLVVDTGPLSVVGSWFLGHLINLQRRARLAGCQFRLACPDTGLREVFQVTKLDHLISVSATVEEAVAAF